MQIHEITKKSLREGALGNIGSGFIQGLTGVDLPRQSQTDATALERATQKRAKQLAQQWEKQIKTQTKPAPAAAAKPSATTQSQPATPSIRSPAEIADMKAKGFDPATGQKITPGTTPSATGTQPIMLGGKRLDPKNPNDAKVLAAMKAQGKLQEATQEYTTPSGIVVPGGTRTDPRSLGIVDFEQWADQQLTTQITGTGQKIDLDTVRKKNPAVKTELDKVLPQIKQDPTSTAAVEQYFLIAINGMQQMANAVKQKNALESK